MFKRDVKNISDLIMINLRSLGLETPLLQRRLIESWPEVAGPLIAKYTREVFIFNQTLMVKLNNPALRHDLSMQRAEYVRRLNERVGAQIIADIRFA